MSLTALVFGSPLKVHCPPYPVFQGLLQPRHGSAHDLRLGPAAMFRASIVAGPLQQSTRMFGDCGRGHGQQLALRVDLAAQRVGGTTTSWESPLRASAESPEAKQRSSLQGSLNPRHIFV